MKTYLFILLLLFITPSFGQNPKGFDKMCDKFVTGSVPLATPQQLEYEANRNKNLHVLDSRETDEYNTSHIPGARLVGYDNFEISALKDIPKNEKIYVYCSIGYRSEKIGEKLLAAGYTKVYNLKGGIFNWSNNGYPIQNSAGTSTSKVHGYSKKWSKWINQDKLEIILQ